LPQADQSEYWQFTGVAVVVLVEVVLVLVRVVEKVRVAVVVAVIVVVNSTCCALLTVMPIAALVKAWLMLWIRALEEDDRSE